MLKGFLTSLSLDLGGECLNHLFGGCFPVDFWWEVISAGNLGFKSDKNIKPRESKAEACIDG